MLKKSIIAIIFILTFIGIWFLFASDKKAAYIEPQVIDGISMVIKENTLTKSGATIIITDSTKEEEHTYGCDFRIEKKENNNWVNLDSISSHNFTSEGYIVNEKNILEMDVKWDWLYGELQSGEYRLIKEYAIKKMTIFMEQKRFLLNSLLTKLTNFFY